MMEQWERPGIVNFSSLEDLHEKIIELQTNEKYRKAMYKASKNYIEETLLLSDINKKRIEILNQLIS
jgi:hypothetical protein